MDVLLIGEASGVHATLKRGLEEHGVRAVHAVAASAASPTADLPLSRSGAGPLNRIERNTLPLLRVLGLDRFDVINFTNSITTQLGRVGRYWDLPLLRRKAALMSYYALSCDELGLIRAHPGVLPYTPCESCQKFDGLFPLDCNRAYLPNHERGLELARRYFDCGFSSMIEYDHAGEGFVGKPFHRIPLPVELARIAFVPAQSRRKVRIVHTPTRRGFKGTAVVLAAIEQLSERRSDFEFRIIEGLPHAEYHRVIADADIVIDQVYSQSPGMNALEMLAMGKIVFSGSTDVGRSYFRFMGESPILDAAPDSGELCSAVGQILDARAEYGGRAERGRSYIAQYHDHRRVAEAFLDVWCTELKSNRKARGRVQEGCGDEHIMT